MVGLVVLAALLLLALGVPIYAVLFAVAAWGATMGQKIFPKEFAGQIDSLIGLGTGDPATVLSTIPLFIFAGYLMAESKTADRVVRFSQALLGWMPGGLAICTIFSCALFTTFTGASGVTIVALGSLLVPALLKQGYPQRFSLGLVAGTGSVGLLFPPALPLIIYGTVYGLAAQTQSSTADGEMKLISFTTDRFLLAGIVPGLVLLGIISVYAIVRAVMNKVPRQRFVVKELFASFVVALPEIALPFLIILGLAVAGMDIPEVAALCVVYVFLVETFLYRDLKLQKLWKLTGESMALVGAIFIIIFAAQAFTSFLIIEEVPKKLVAWMTQTFESKWTFLLGLNVLLLLVGMLMDIFSAIVVVVPLITPVAAHYGVDPYHLGIIFLLNLEIGYLTPPVGLNLFITSFAFKKPILEVVRAALPFLLCMIVALAAITYIPALTIVPPPERKGRLSVLLNDVDNALKLSSGTREITLPDGTKLTRKACAADLKTKDACEGLFVEFSQCGKLPDAAQSKACQDKAINSWVEASKPEDDDWSDEPAETDAGAAPSADGKE